MSDVRPAYAKPSMQVQHVLGLLLLCFHTHSHSVSVRPGSRLQKVPSRKSQRAAELRSCIAASLPGNEMESGKRSFEHPTAKSNPPVQSSLRFVSLLHIRALVLGAYLNLRSHQALDLHAHTYIQRLSCLQVEDSNFALAFSLALVLAFNAGWLSKASRPPYQSGQKSSTTPFRNALSCA